MSIRSRLKKHHSPHYYFSSFSSISDPHRIGRKRRRRNHGQSAQKAPDGTQCCVIGLYAAWIVWEERARVKIQKSIEGERDKGRLTISYARNIFLNFWNTRVQHCDCVVLSTQVCCDCNEQAWEEWEWSDTPWLQWRSKGQQKQTTFLLICKKRWEWKCVHIRESSEWQLERKSERFNTIRGRRGHARRKHLRHMLYTWWNNSFAGQCTECTMDMESNMWI